MDSRIEVRRISPIWPLGIVVGLIMLCGVSVWIRDMRVQAILHDAFAAKPFEEAPSAPWSEIYAAAQIEAAKKDTEAILSRIDVWPEGASLSYFISSQYQGWDQINVSTTLQLAFTYYCPTGKEMTVYLSDSSPTKSISSHLDDDPDFRQMHIEDYTAALERQQSGVDPSRIIISPRQALSLTWQEAAQYGKDKQSFEHVAAHPGISMWLNSHGLAWDVDYDMIDPLRPTRDRVNGPIAVDEAKINFVVDAVTGAIIERNPR